MESLEAQLRRIVREEVRAELAPILAQLGTPASGRDETEYLSVAEAAELAGVVPGTIRSWVGRGDIAAQRAGQRIRIRRDELERYLARGREPAVDGDAEGRLRELLREVG